MTQAMLVDSEGRAYTDAIGIAKDVTIGSEGDCECCGGGSGTPCCNDGTTAATYMRILAPWIEFPVFLQDVILQLASTEECCVWSDCINNPIASDAIKSANCVMQICASTPANYATVEIAYYLYYQTNCGGGYDGPISLTQTVLLTPCQGGSSDNWSWYPCDQYGNEL